MSTPQVLRSITIYYNELQRSTKYHEVLQYTTIIYNLLQRTTKKYKELPTKYNNLLQRPIYYNLMGGCTDVI